MKLVHYFKKSGMEKRICEEVPHQLKAAEAYDELANFITGRSYYYNYC